MFKKFILIFLILAAIGFLSVYLANERINRAYENQVTSNIQKLPNSKAGLVLGTSKTLANGSTNYYFKYRIDAAEELYKAGKVKYLIVSGDNSQKHYNEPEDMQKELISRGIPKEHIFMDFAGFRTLDSVVRAKEIFSQDSLIIVSQKFHNERAVYIAEHFGMNAYGYNAKDVNRYTGFKTNIREKFARVKVFFDLIFGVKPKFSGEKVVIP